MIEQLHQQAGWTTSGSPASPDQHLKRVHEAMQNGRDEGYSTEELPYKRHAYEGHPDFKPADHPRVNADCGEQDHTNSYRDDDEDSYQHATPVSPALLPGGPKSLSGISMRAFSLGLTLGMTSFLSLYLSAHTTFWRAPAFIALLSLFHFLEFWTIARYNTPQANTSAYLLTSNGSAYNIAHSSAMLEFLISQYFGFSIADAWVPQRYKNVPLTLGVLLVLVGQTTRSLAMAQAGTSFNHHVQTRRSAGHELVTNGIFAWLRHPSYFGFFWWGLGTQLLLGNIVCLVGFTLVLWRFFKRRIKGMPPLEHRDASI
jgi:protein-S-isoprenylcysteine O-methyltransferase